MSVRVKGGGDYLLQIIFEDALRTISADSSKIKLKFTDIIVHYLVLFIEEFFSKHFPLPTRKNFFSVFYNFLEQLQVEFGNKIC